MIDLSDRLGAYREAVEVALDELEEQETVKRIWQRDYTVWKPDPAEIANRLGWLDIAERIRPRVPELNELARTLNAGGYTDVLLLGMGGSSLAPEVFRQVFGVREGFLDLAVLDSTDPGAVLSHASRLDLSRTLFVVATKSGGTVETLSFFRFFYNRTVEARGVDEAGAHFVAITDAGSKLDEIASRYGFRATFRNDPNIGGRYSALSFFGLAPAALVGVNVPLLLERAVAMERQCGDTLPVSENPAARLGTILGELAKAGRDKLTLIASPSIASFGEWVEQLIAESTGKEGKGIFPVIGEPLGPPDVYGDDRLFIYLRLDDAHDADMARLEEAGQPVVRLNLDDRYDLGGQFFLWEMATAIAGNRLGIQPFNQPNVEATKALARQMVAAYIEKGEMPVSSPVLSGGGIDVYGDIRASSVEEALRAFLDQARPGDYVAIQAYIQPTEEATRNLQTLRLRLRDRYRLATSVGYGPRYLHSTGQLHKGDGGNGLFIQITGDAPQDVPIPDEPGSPEASITFGVLKLAQALGDYQALKNAGRRVIRFHVGQEVLTGLRRLAASL